MILRLALRPGLLLFLAAGSSGCLTIYQPQLSLQRPVAVDPELGNFDGVRMLIRCVPGEYSDDEDSALLCRKLRPMFANQGAEVEVEVPSAHGGRRIEEPGAAEPDLIIDLTSRLLHSESSVGLWLICFATGTLVPSITDATFAQDVIIRDKSGFLLSSDSLQGRFVRYFGLGIWAVNGIVDLIARARGQRLSGSNATEDFSKDFYGQMSQLAFHAQMRARVLRNFDGEPLAPAVKASAAAPTRAAPAAAVSAPVVPPPVKAAPKAPANSAPSNDFASPWDAAPEKAQPTRPPPSAPPPPPPPPK